MRVSFQEELDELEASLRMEGELVLRSLRGAVEVVVSQDLELADEVIAFDDDIDSQYFEVEQGIELLLARQTPVASDLRLVLAVLKDNLHLERMGDLCVTIAKLTKLTKGLEPDEALLEGFKEMGERAEQMIRVALRVAGAARPSCRRVAPGARRADRPGEPARRQPPARSRRTISRCGSGVCG